MVANTDKRIWVFKTGYKGREYIQDNKLSAIYYTHYETGKVSYVFFKNKTEVAILNRSGNIVMTQDAFDRYEAIAEEWKKEEFLSTY